MHQCVTIGPLPVHRFDGDEAGYGRTPSASGASASVPAQRDSGPDAPIVVAIHGITANGLSFAQLAASVPRLWAPDLRGRADARDLPGPWGLPVHADDVIGVLEAAVAEQGSPVVLAGHSMGAFVAALAAGRRPELVSRLVLIDGGLAFPLPPGASTGDVDAMITAVIGPAMARLSMTFAGEAAYLDFWAEHPALGPLVTSDSPAGERARTYLLHDLVPADGGGYRSSCVLDAVRADGADVLIDAEAHAAPASAAAAGVPIRMLWAARGLQNEPQGLYDPTRIAALDLPADIEVAPVPDVNHYTVLFESNAVAQVSAALLD